MFEVEETETDFRELVLNNTDGLYWLVMKCMVFKKYLDNANMFIEKTAKLKQLSKLQLNCVQ